MDQFIWFRDKGTSTTTMHTYHVLNGNGNGNEFKLRGEKVNKVDTIIFSLTGDGSKIQRNVYNKNFVSYYLPVSSFSLRYGEDAPTDIFFGGKEIIFGGRKEYPLMLSFYKIHKSLYVIVLIPNINKMNLKGDLLGKIINYNDIQ